MGTISTVFSSHVALSLGHSRLWKEIVLWQTNTLQFVYKVTPTSPSFIREPESFWSLSFFLAVFLIIPIFQCYWVLEYLLCVAAFLPPFSSYFLLACVLSLFVTSPLSHVQAGKHQALHWFRMLYHVLFVSSVHAAVQFLSLFPCKDLALPTINFLCLFFTLFLSLPCPLRVSFPQGTRGGGKSSVSVTMLPSLQFWSSAMG